MRYFKSAVTIENGKYKYGNLPEDYVVGYVHEGTGFFSLHPAVRIPDDADVQEIGIEEYEDLLQQVNQQEQTKRLEEREELIAELEKAQQEKAAETEALAQRFMTPEERYKNAYLLKDTSLLSLKELKIAALKEACSQTTYEGFKSASTGYYFGFNALDQSNFTQRMLTIVAGAQGPFEWKAVDAGVVSLTKGEFVTLISEAEAHKLSQQRAYWALEVDVLEAETNEEVNAIKWLSESEEPVEEEAPVEVPEEAPPVEEAPEPEPETPEEETPVVEAPDVSEEEETGKA